MHCNICGSLHLRGLLVTPPFRKRNTTHSSALWRRKKWYKTAEPTTSLSSSVICLFSCQCWQHTGEKMSNYASSPAMLFSFTLFGFFDWTAQGNDLYTLHSSTFQLCHATNVSQHSVLKQHSTATLSDAEKKCITHTHACMHACTHIRMHARTHTYTHAHTVPSILKRHKIKHWLTVQFN